MPFEIKAILKEEHCPGHQNDSFLFLEMSWDLSFNWIVSEIGKTSYPLNE